jgi:hypothetical protein
MRCHELAIEQSVTADIEPGDQPCQRDLRSIGLQREHALPKKGRTQPNAVQSTDQSIALPGLNRMRVPGFVERDVALFDLRVDPRFVAIGAMAHDIRESLVAGDPEHAGFEGLAQRT